MSGKLCTIQYPPGARGDFLAVCVWLLYNNNNEEYNWEDICWITEQGKVMFTGKIMPGSKITKYSLEKAYTDNKPMIKLWQQHMTLDNYLHSNDNELLKNMLTSCDVMKYVKEYTEDKNYPVIPLPTHFGWSLDSLNSFLLYDKFLKDISVTENIYVVPENINEMIEMTLLFSHKDFVDFQNDSKGYETVLLKVASFIETIKWLDKIDANVFSYSKIKTLSIPKLAKYIISKLGIQTTINIQFIRFVEEYRRVSEEYELKLVSDVNDVYNNLMLYHESFKYSSEIIKRGEDEYRNSIRD